MKIGFGLPNAVPDLPHGRLLVQLASRAEERGFSTLATIGRIAYPNYEELVTLAAAAGATERIGLQTDVLLGPAREPGLLAKQAASLDQLSSGRFVLGTGVGGRTDDFAVTGHAFGNRGRRWDESLELIHAAWAGEIVPGATRPVTPRPVNGRSVPMMFGGRADQAVERVVRWGVGYTQGGGTPESLQEMMKKVEAAWSAAGREGRPRFQGLAYFAFGKEAQEWAKRSLKDYYGEYGDRVWAGAVKDPEEVPVRVEAYQAVGADELIFFSAGPAVEQVDLLREALGEG